MKKTNEKNGMPACDAASMNCDIHCVVEALSESSVAKKLTMERGSDDEPLPSREEVARIVEDLRCVLFPGYFGVSEVNAGNIKFHIGSALDRARRSLEVQIRRGMCFVCDGNRRPNCEDCAKEARTITCKFISRLPEIQRLLATDVQAAYDGDPAATSADETIFCYPGIIAITNHRIAHELHKLEVPLLPRMISELAHGLTGIDIHPGASIGERFFMDHGTGVVIGETCIIGDRVRIYQGVTLGGRSFPIDKDGRLKKGIPRHPIVEDDVVIYTNASLLGRITIGKGASIGGNVWITQDVPPGSKVNQSHAELVVSNSGGKK